MDDQRQFRRTAQNELTDFVCPQCNHGDWEFSQRSDHWDVQCTNCQTSYISVKPDIHRTGGETRVIQPRDPEELNTIWCVLGLLQLLWHPVLLYQYIRAGWILRHQMFREETTRIQATSLQVSDKFQRGLQLLQESAEEGSSLPIPAADTAHDVALTLLQETEFAVQEEEARELARHHLSRLYWLHPIRLYNQLIKYAPHDDRVTTIHGTNTLQIAQSIDSFRRESSYGHQPDYVG